MYTLILCSKIYSYYSIVLSYIYSIGIYLNISSKRLLLILGFHDPVSNVIWGYLFSVYISQSIFVKAVIILFGTYAIPKILMFDILSISNLFNKLLYYFFI
jgi:hypothetical protein